MKNIVSSSIYFCIYYFLFFTNFSFSADLPKSKDPNGIKRYEGTEIIRYEQFEYESYQLPLGKMTKFDFGTKKADFTDSKNIEGKLTRVSYRLADPQRSSLEIFRNYQQDLKDSGWEVLWQASNKAEFGNSFTHIFESLRDNDQLFTYNDDQAHVLCITKPSDGLYAMLFVTKFQQGLSRGLKVDKGDPIIQLDVIETKKMEQRMVFVSAPEMQKAINQQGRIALYGITFDFNKVDIKQESLETISEIAKLLNDSPKLRILIAGHTDNVGDFEFNRELSHKRAQAVANMLTTKYSIAASRLMHFGVSFASPVASNETEEGKAKNRRVEIVAVH